MTLIVTNLKSLFITQPNKKLFIELLLKAMQFGAIATAKIY